MRFLSYISFWCLLVVAQLFSQTVNAEVWSSANNYWNDSWEVKYQNWVAKNWKEDFL